MPATATHRHCLVCCCLIPNEVIGKPYFDHWSQGYCSLGCFELSLSLSAAQLAARQEGNRHEYVKYWPLSADWPS